MPDDCIALPREPMEAACEACGDFYTPCVCDRVDRVFTEHADLVDVLEKLESRLETGRPVEHDDELRMRMRRLLASVYRGEGQR